LKRALEYTNYKVKHVMNITDVGHLTSDSDEGQDKLEKGAIREHKTVWEIAEFYTDAFLKDMQALNIKKPSVLVKATDTIAEQIKLIQILEQKGFTYIIDDGVYFDTAKLGRNYGCLWSRTIKKKLRSRIEENKQKRILLILPYGNLVLKMKKTNGMGFTMGYWFPGMAHRMCCNEY